MGPSIYYSSALQAGMQNDVDNSSEPDRESNIRLVSYAGQFKGSPDLLLKSLDNVLYNVHSSVMAEASNVFRDMFLVPRDPSKPLEDDVIQLDESGAHLELLLNTIYSITCTPYTSSPSLTAVLSQLECTSHRLLSLNPTSTLTSTTQPPSTFSILLHLADKYDIPPLHALLSHSLLARAHKSKSLLASLDLYTFAWSHPGLEDAARDIALHVSTSRGFSSSSMVQRSMRRMHPAAASYLKSVVSRKRDGTMPAILQDDDFPPPEIG